MRHARYLLPMVVGFGIALWGCAPEPSASGADKALEAKVAKLEKDLRATQDATAKLDEQLRAERAKAAAVEKERDAARGESKARGDELAKASGDLAKANGELEGVRKGLKELLGRVDAALAPPTSEKPSDAIVTVRPPDVK